MTRDQILELAKKVHALATKGVGGEKENAEAFLKKLIKKHGIELTDVVEEAKKEYTFICKSIDQKKFLYQVIASVIGRDFKSQYAVNNRRKVFIMLTVSEYIEIDTKFNYFWKLWQDELGLFYDAFVQTNSLYSKIDGKESVPKDLSPEEKQRLRRMFEMMDTIKKGSINKQIEV
jgi:hypothetical protein